MTRAQILRKKTGIVLAIIGIVFSLLPAVRMADGSKLFIFQLIGNETFFGAEKIAEEPGAVITGVLLCVVFIYGLLVHILNLVLWLRKSEKTFIGVMGLSLGSFLALIMSAAFIVAFGAPDGSEPVRHVAQFPFTIWQCFRVLITLSEAVIKLNGEELFNVFFPEK